MSQPLLIVLATLGAALLLAVLAAAALVLRDPAGATRHVESLFRRPPKPPKAPGRGHYYKPYWS